jgi:hypothetical protein
MIARLFKALLVLVVIAALAVIAYAYLGDLSPAQTEVRQPVTLDADE